MELRVAGHSVFVETLGHGGALVTLHGGPGLDHAWFRPALDALSTKAKVVFYDQADCGRSARDVPLEGGYGTWVAELEGLRVALGVDRMVLLGHSAGSQLALAYAAQFPANVAGLVLCAASAKFDFMPQAMEMGQRLHGAAKMQEWIAAVSAPARDDAHYRAIWKQILPLYFKRFDPRVAAEIEARARFSAAALNYGMGVAAPAFDVVAQLPSIGAPTLLVNGASDWLAPHDACTRPLLAGLPHARLEVFEQSGHFPFIEERARFVKLVGEFLDALE
jgi:proline iminopeptidase